MFCPDADEREAPPQTSLTLRVVWLPACGGFGMQCTKGTITRCTGSRSSTSSSKVVVAAAASAAAVVVAAGAAAVVVAAEHVSANDYRP